MIGRVEKNMKNRQMDGQKKKKRRWMAKNGMEGMDKNIGWKNMKKYMDGWKDKTN